jgi:hypothetical protein
MTWMRRLKADYLVQKLAFLHPARQLDPQPALSFWCMKYVCCMQCVPGKWRISLAGYDQNISRASFPRLVQKTAKSATCLFYRVTMEIEARVYVHVAARHLLLQSAIKPASGFYGCRAWQ